MLTCMICGQTVKSGFQALLKAPLAGARRAMLGDPAPVLQSMSSPMWPPMGLRTHGGKAVEALELLKDMEEGVVKRPLTSVV